MTNKSLIKKAINIVFSIDSDDPRFEEIKNLLTINDHLYTISGSSYDPATIEPISMTISMRYLCKEDLENYFSKKGGE